MNPKPDSDFQAELMARATIKRAQAVELDRMALTRHSPVGWVVILRGRRS
jgi:hypothetical protein